MTGDRYRPLSVSGLAADLQRLGVRAGDTLMVHASLFAIGPVDGGAAGVLDGLKEAVGGQGTLLMILGAKIDHEWVNRRPEAERAALLADAPPYDPAAAPASPEIGVLAEVFRRCPGVRVTDNPCGRFASSGRLADTLLRDAPWNDYYGPGSPLERLCDVGGRVLRLGADPDTTTVMHYAEYLAETPDKRRVRRHYRVLGKNGPEIRSVECLDDEKGIVDWPGEDYFALILMTYLASGKARIGRVGRTSGELIEARDIVDFSACWMSENFRAGGSDHGSDPSADPP